MTGTELERHEPRTIDVSTVDSWVQVFGPIIQLAEHVHATDFVPQALRGNAPATAAAMLYGRELGMGPMRSLRTVHMVDGRPTLAAEQMRAMVLAAGHDLVYREHTRARCVVAGRRRGSTAYTEVNWTLDDAREMGIAGKPNWRRMPRQMLVARATAELCRMIFADVIGGAYATEELDDEVEPANAAVPNSAPKRRTAKRKTPVARPPQQATEPSSASPQEAVDLAGKPPLPGEIDDAQQVHHEQPADPDPDADARGVSPAQLKRLHTFFSAHGIDDRDDKLAIARALTGRADLRSSTELTHRQAAQLIDALGQLEAQAGDDVGRALELLLTELNARAVTEPDSPPDEQGREGTS